MTTKSAERLYEAQHVHAHSHLKVAIYNPRNKPVRNLPVIYGFNNGSYGPGMFSAVLLAEDGKDMGGHLCSSEAYMPADLGVLEGTRPDRHEGFRKHYPNGYRMEFIGSDFIDDHKGLLAAISLANELNNLANKNAG